MDKGVNDLDLFFYFSSCFLTILANKECGKVTPPGTNMPVSSKVLNT